MILRRREAQTLDSLDSLVTYLRDAREERKAVITITNGWRFTAPTTTLADRFAVRCRQSRRSRSIRGPAV